MDLHDTLRVLYRRRWLAGAAFSIPAVLALVHAFTATPVYRATARMLIESENPQVVTFEEVIQERGQFGMNVQTTQRDMLRSRSLARATIDELGLWDHPEFGGSGGRARFSLIGTLIGTPIRWVRRGLSWVRSVVFPAPGPPEGAADAESRAESRAISSLLARLQVVAGRQSRILTLHYSAFEPKLAADVVNTLAELHVARDMEFRYTSSRNASRWLQQRIAEQRQKLEASERALQSYRESRGAAAVEDRQNIIVRELENLHAAATEATMARIESETRYRDLAAAQDDADALVHFPEILGNDVIEAQKLALANLRQERARLAEELGPRHPDMVSIESSIREGEERLRNEVLAVVDSLRIEYRVASSRERQLQAELDAQTQEALALDRTGIEYGVMRREAESDRRLYESLLQRAAETGVTGELETSNIRVLDTAETPVAPNRPRRQLIVLIGLLGGACLAIGSVFGLEWLDDTVTTPEEIKTHLEMPFLGTVPLVKTKAAGRGRKAPGLFADSAKGPWFLSDEAPANFAEALSSLRTGLVFAEEEEEEEEEERARRVAITSSGPGEGKSVLTATLAVSLARLGLRTLLVDTDLRRPQQHANFDTDLEPGLSNLLVGDATKDAVVRETPVPGLSLVTAGRLPPGPADLLASGRFAALVGSWRARFDWILFDTVPILPVTDGLVVAKAVRRVMFVVSSGSTSRRVADVALGNLREAGVRVLGGVLNKAALERHPYYYSRYYRREYSRYYSRSPAG